MKIAEISMLDPFYQEERELRNSVLLRPIGMPDFAWEMRDPDAWHFVCTIDEKVVGCVVLCPDKDPEKVQFIQMAVYPKFQKQGIGQMLLDSIIAFSKQKGFKEIFCHARFEVKDFYSKNKFIDVGDIFVEVGIKHQKMKLLIYQSTPSLFA